MLTLSAWISRTQLNNVDDFESIADKGSFDFLLRQTDQRLARNERYVDPVSCDVALGRSRCGLLHLAMQDDDFIETFDVRHQDRCRGRDSCKTMS